MLSLFFFYRSIGPGYFLPPGRLYLPKFGKSTLLTACTRGGGGGGGGRGGYKHRFYGDFGHFRFFS